MWEWLQCCGTMSLSNFRQRQRWLRHSIDKCIHIIINIIYKQIAFDFVSNIAFKHISAKVPSEWAWLLDRDNRIKLFLLTKKASKSFPEGAIDP